MERNSALKQNARELRKNQTKEERLLWNAFLSKYPHRFKRQYIIGNYIVDFYCHAAKLAVELDGSQHYDPETIEYDKKRTEYLQSQNIQVLRFSNLDVTRQFRSVCEVIDTEVKRRANQEEV